MLTFYSENSVSSSLECLQFRKEEAMRMIVIAGLALILMLRVACPVMSTESGTQKMAAYEGTWVRIEKYANGTPLKVDETATLVLTKDTFASVSKGVPGAECDNSGKLLVNGEMMTMTVTASTCPSIITVGSIVKSAYSLSVDKTRLTLINNEWGYTYKEVLKRQ
jgi:hypothetical protein